MSENRDAVRRELILSSVTCEAPEVGVWLASLSDCRARTHKALAGLRADELDWIRPPGRNTIGTLLYHIAAIELDWLYTEILEHEFPNDFREWVVHHLLQHEAEHRGHIAMLRDRFKDSHSPPSIK